MLDVALATTAAPTYFPIAEIDDEYYVDGGVWAIILRFAGLQDALEYFVGADKKLQGVNQGKVFDKYAILSIGSVHEDAAWSMKGRFGLKKRKNRSFLGWRAKLLQTALDGQSYSVHRLLKVLVNNTKAPANTFASNQIPYRLNTEKLWAWIKRLARLLAFLSRKAEKWDRTTLRLARKETCSNSFSKLKSSLKPNNS